MFGGEDVEKENPDTAGRIILPENLQREMIQFFMRASALKIAETEGNSVSDSQQTSPKTKES